MCDLSAIYNSKHSKLFLYDLYGMQTGTGIASSALEATLTRAAARIYLQRDTCSAASWRDVCTHFASKNKEKEKWLDEWIDGQMSGMKLTQIPMPFMVMYR